MKKIEAIARPSAVGKIYEALERRALGGMTLSEVHGFGHARGQTPRYRGAAYGVAGQTRVRLEIVAPDAQVGPIVQVVMEEARTGQVGDGVIAIHAVEEAVRIRTGERGVEAISADPVRPLATVAEPGAPVPAPARVVSS